MKKLLAVAVVTLLAGGVAFAQTMPYGFINDDGTAVSGDPIQPSAGTASFIRTQNLGPGTVSLTVVHSNTSGVAFHSNTGVLTAGNFFSWRPRAFQGITPNGTGATANGSITILHTGAPGQIGGNVVVISSNGSRLGFLALEQI